jgi:hypothetical protein
MSSWKPGFVTERTAVPTSDRYGTRADANGRFAVEDQQTETVVDSYRTRAVAESYARALNAEAARIAPHAIIGCRIQALSCRHCRGRGCDRCRRSADAS